MPRRKQLTFHIQDLRCAGHIVEELSKLPQGYSVNVPKK